MGVTYASENHSNVQGKSGNAKPQRTPPVFYAGGVTVDDILECGLVQLVYEDAYNAALSKTYDGETNLHKKKLKTKQLSASVANTAQFKL